jgi:Protein of unknown function (DUF2917)
MDAHANFTEDKSTIRISIASGDVTPIQNGRGIRLHVECGAVWITQDRSTADVFLKAGESFRIERNGLTLVSAIAPAPFTLVTVAPATQTAWTLLKRFAAAFVRARIATARERARDFIHPYY